jgi:hypothetical protein
MNTRYKAFETLMMDPVVVNSAATLGIADRTVVDDIGAKKLQKDKTAVMICFLLGVNLL